ncbi:hypothetical protein [Larkinella terrae]|uniref:Uncharacterized protein n=1 Tax=Larkinella terrae TaxID=2025311 RepID=A0A7K0ER65_9BACT|nr:hypothetical protein [Larkinella terrae]MRS64051.1 hypothetical protein [Larkinella terrae]
MKSLILLLFLQTGVLFAQSNVTGLGMFRIGITTPDSLPSAGFREEEPPVVKGTLALVCTDIRLFKADSVEIQGVSITGLFLVFYENRLARITCTYDDLLEKAFSREHGKGKIGPPQLLSLCDEGRDKRMTLTSENWENDGILALAVHARGYNARCRAEQASRLTIASQSFLAITSECDLESLDPYFDKIRSPH